MKDKLKTGDILICTSNRLLPSIIKWATKSKWTHTAQYFDNEWGCGIAEAQSNGIAFKPFEEWEKKYKYNYVVFRKHAQTDFDKETTFKRAFSKSGFTGYDFESFVIRQPFKLLTGKYKYRGELREVKRMICSEYTGWTNHLQKWWQMTPDDVYNYLNKSNRWFKFEK